MKPEIKDAVIGGIAGTVVATPMMMMFSASMLTGMPMDIAAMLGGMLDPDGAPPFMAGYLAHWHTAGLRQKPPKTSLKLAEMGAILWPFLNTLFSRGSVAARLTLCGFAALHPRRADTPVLAATHRAHRLPIIDTIQVKLFSLDKRENRVGQCNTASR